MMKKEDARNVEKTRFPVKFDPNLGVSPVSCRISRDSQHGHGIDAKMCYLRILIIFSVLCDVSTSVLTVL